MNTNRKQTDIGLIPEDWEVDYLGNIVISRKGLQRGPWGGSIKKEIFVEKGFQVFEQSNVIHNNFFVGRYYITKDKFLELKDFEVTPGDILITAAGTMGKIRIVPPGIQKGIINQALLRVRLNDTFIDKTFFVYLFENLVNKGLIEKYSHGATLKNLTSIKHLSKIEIPLPPLPEQKKITHVLSKIQQAIETQEQIIKTTQELKKALMQKLFTEGLPASGGAEPEPQKQTEIGPIPESWVVADLEKTGDVVYGIQAAVAHLKEPIGLPILTNKNITLDGKIDLSKLNYFELKTKRHFATILKKGDILFNWRSGSKEHVGKTAYFNLEGEYVHSSFILRIRPKSDVNNKYLYYYLTYLRLSEYFIKLHSYSINAKFNKSAVNKLPTVLPPIDVQELVADYLTDIDIKITAEENKLLYLKDLFSSSLNNLITGQIRVKDMEFKLEELKYH